MINEIKKSNSKSNDAEELSKEISNKYWYDKNGKAKTYETINLNNGDLYKGTYDSIAPLIEVEKFYKVVAYDD